MAPATENTPLTPEQLVEQLRKLREQIPDYAQMSTSEAGSLRQAAQVALPFVHAAINANGASPAVAAAIGRDADALRQELADQASWSAFEDEARALLQGIVAANLKRRHRIGLTALQTYQISRQLVRKPEHQDLAPHVAEMKRTNRLGNRRRVRKSTEGQPGPVSTSPTTTPGQPAPVTPSQPSTPPPKAQLQLQPELHLPPPTT